MKKTRITLILGIIIGVIATLTVVVYASETLFNSKDISYTNENTEVTNVKDAVDELYNSINISNGVFNITLKERDMPITLERNTEWLKKTIDTALNQILNDINSFTEIEVTELNKLKNGEYTWSSSDTSILTISGEKVTPKKLGNVRVTAKTNGGASVTIPLRIIQSSYLSDVVNVGD